MKKCPACKQEKPLTNEYYGKSKAAKNGFRPACKECERKRCLDRYYKKSKDPEYNKARYLKLKQNPKALDKARKLSKTLGKRKRDKIGKEIIDYKKKNCCESCGESDFRCLDFDHIDPSKKSFTIAHRSRRSEKDVRDEINKCRILCANCHLLFTNLNNGSYKRLDPNAKTGTSALKLIYRNKRYIYKHLQSCECIDCGERNRILLEFDHKDGVEKKFRLAMPSSRSIETIQKEIDKCDIRCRNCHRKRTAKQLNHFSYNT